MSHFQLFLLLFADNIVICFLSPPVVGGAQHGHTATPAATAHCWRKAPPGVSQRARELVQSHGWILPGRALLQQQGTEQTLPPQSLTFYH